VAVIIIATIAAWRYTAIVIGTGCALAVAATWVYLVGHYPIDVPGGVLCARAAGFVVTGVAALPALQSHLGRLDMRSGGRH
jgi:hypothetical protein